MNLVLSPIIHLKNRKKETDIQAEILEITNKNIDAEDYNQARKQYQIITKLTMQLVDNQIEESYKYDPEAILCENERKKMLQVFWQSMKDKISPSDLAYLMKYVENKNNALATAEALGINHMIVIRMLERIKKAKDELVEELNLSEDELLYCFRPQINNYLTQSASHVGYPSEAYMNLPSRRSWTIKYGSKRFNTKARCLIPEFLEESNLKCTYCTICNEGYKCTRKDVYPLNAEPTKAIEENLKRLKECVKCFWETHKEEDFSNLLKVNKI